MYKATIAHGLSRKQQGNGFINQVLDAVNFNLLTYIYVASHLDCCYNCLPDLVAPYAARG